MVLSALCLCGLSFNIKGEHSVKNTVNDVTSTVHQLSCVKHACPAGSDATLSPAFVQLVALFRPTHSQLWYALCLHCLGPNQQHYPFL